MRRAVTLAKRGFPAPNPRVGCVLARDGVILAGGFHAAAGTAHAEVAALSALAASGGNPRGATAYVTLEPCHHQGRTGPCSHALVAAGIARVVYAVPDPNPRAAGGTAFLREHGVTVETGVEAAAAEEVNRYFLGAQQLGRTYVVVKAAISMDGRIALPSGESKWITGPRARREGHRLRAECGAVLVGRGTVAADDPHLTARIPGVQNPPTRIVLDPRDTLDRTRYRVFDDAAPTWHVTGEIDLAEFLRQSLVAGITAVLVEGGAETIRRLIRAELVDEIELFLAPKILGAGPAWVGDLGIEQLVNSPTWTIQRTVRVAEDLRINFRPLR
ncbi:MAG: bifunctional diaminohydroxyphosphoribosylaminopyrimidine deaminase/5-amino-6-(5-phosphoribosylamino)uracil reductase RibD [Fimbriimonadaceae bacterium]|nr:bifunctional diaminohydroxyphosphoribosylaminopyrimidine deaminase/5-amino-6-(5-phosphoribosylamino)uracil reductase RibD [Fimbriimonadaceae bacterium]